jgi:glycerophosphoryl diester phosphodiesterase
LTDPLTRLKAGSVRPLVIAHRGASGSCPENTLAAFRRAEALGSDMIELDVQLSRDGEVVVIHDWTLDRTTTGSGPVGEHSLAELRALDAGSWFAPTFKGERVPTLAEVLAGVRLRVNVELKPVGDEGLEAAALAVVENAGALDRVVFSSFEAAALERLRARSRSASVAVLWETDRLEEAIVQMERVDARALHLRKDAATPSVLAQAAERTIRVRVWTVNEPADFRRLAIARVDGVFTDFPERFLHQPMGE